MRSTQVSLLMAVLSGWTAAARGQSSLVGTTFHMTRATAPIRIDGDLSDEAWRTATRDTGAVWYGADRHRYAFRVRARDRHGNVSGWNVTLGSSP